VNFFLIYCAVLRGEVNGELEYYIMELGDLHTLCNIVQIMKSRKQDTQFEKGDKKCLQNCDAEIS
jgi:hypothetical protein